MDHIVGF